MGAGMALHGVVGGCEGLAVHCKELQSHRSSSDRGGYPDRFGELLGLEQGKADSKGNVRGDAPMALDLNNPELEFADLVTAYQSWVMIVINDEKLGGDKLLTDNITDDALNAMRFLPDVVTSAIETTLARVYDVDPDELSELLYPEG
jgi:hypothetical protein